MELYAYQIAIFVVLYLFVSETTPLCCHLPYMQSLPCGIESKSVTEIKLLAPTDQGREVGMPSSVDIITDLASGLCSYSMCAPGYIKKKGVYCATGSCNVFGCNCDGECINKDYVDGNLQRLRRESDNINLTYENLSRARRSTKVDKTQNTNTIYADGKLESHTPTIHSQGINLSRARRSTKVDKTQNTNTIYTDGKLEPHTPTIHSQASQVHQ